MTSQEKKELLKQKVVIIQEYEKYSGGQSCGMPPMIAIGKHEELGIEIKIGLYRHGYKNRELLQTVFDLIFDEIIK